MKKRKYSVRRGEGWDTILKVLDQLARRQVTKRCPLNEVQMVYDVIDLAKRYEKEASPKTVAEKLIEKSKKAKKE